MIDVVNTLNRLCMIVSQEELQTVVKAGWGPCCGEIHTVRQQVSSRTYLTMYTEPMGVLKLLLINR